MTEISDLMSSISKHSPDPLARFLIVVIDVVPPWSCWLMAESVLISRDLPTIAWLLLLLLLVAMWCRLPDAFPVVQQSRTVTINKQPILATLGPVLVFIFWFLLWSLDYFDDDYFLFWQFFYYRFLFFLLNDEFHLVDDDNVFPDGSSLC